MDDSNTLTIKQSPLELLEEEMVECLLIEAVNSKRAEIFENVVFEGKRRYYIEDLSVRDFTLENTTPYQLQIFDDIIEESSWGELLRRVALCLFKKFPDRINTITNFRCQWTKQKMFSLEKKTNYKELKEGLYINVNHTALHSCWFLQDILDYFEIDKASVHFLIHRPSGAEPEKVKEYILKRTKKNFSFFLTENYQMDEERTQTVLSIIELHLNPLLRTVSKSYTDFFLFDNNTTLYNYVKRVKGKIDVGNYSEGFKDLLNKILTYIVKYYRN